MIHMDGVLELSIDDIPARLVAEGSELRLEVRRPFRLLRTVSLRSVLRLAVVLNRLGLTLRVVARRRTVLLLGRGIRSRTGRLLLRSPHVGFRDAPPVRTRH
jgi:hypothetical protein